MRKEVLEKHPPPKERKKTGADRNKARMEVRGKVAPYKKRKKHKWRKDESIMN